MGDSERTLEKARKELEELYLGVPDESVNLTFQDFAEVKKSIPNPKITKQGSISSLNKLPSLDFSRGLARVTSQHHDRHQQYHHLDHPTLVADHNDVVDRDINKSIYSHETKTRDPSLNRDMHTTMNNSCGDDHHHQQHQRQHHAHHDYAGHGIGRNRNVHHIHENPKPSTHSMGMEMRHNLGFEDHYSVNGVSLSSDKHKNGGDGGHWRPGIPHSNICTICSAYIYVFKHRCLVCGRVYCRNCVAIGMGDMTEGRKCIECLGRRFSQRYISRAGTTGCCWIKSWRYSSAVREAELKCAEKGPHKNQKGARYGRSSVMMARINRSSVLDAATPSTPTHRLHHQNHRLNGNSISHTNPPSFVMTTSASPHSPYTPTHHLHLQHHLPF